MVFDAHGRAFAFFRGACARGIYDNRKTAVETIFIGRLLGRKQEGCRWQRIRYSRKMPVSESRSMQRESRALSKLSQDALS